MQRWPRFTLCSLLIGICCATAQAQPRERDVWRAYVVGDLRYGHEHTTVARLPDGNFRHVVDVRLLLDLFGAQKQEHTLHAEYVATPTYEPVSFQRSGQMPSGPVRASGSVKDGKLTVSALRAGIEETGTLDLPPGAMFAVCLDDWINDQPREPVSRTVKLIGEETRSIQPGTVAFERQEGKYYRWTCDLGMDGGRGTLFYDKDGILYESSLAIPKLHVRRCTAAEAQDIQHRKLVDRDVLMFPIKKDVARPDRLSELTVKLSWKDIPFDQFALEDDRQRLVSKSEQERSREAVVRITTPAPLPTEMKYPFEGPQFAPYLAETRFIKPNDKKIVATAREIVAGKETALEAVRALSEWVSKYIEPSLIAETLSGPDVLACKKGKCSEYATLFGSLTRSVGIPTRIVLGERMVTGNWAGHMWNEAYVGRWITVDASANEVGQSFALLKFIHSDTVMGTQALRWGLTESLDITVTDFQARPSRLADQYQTGVKGSAYTNVDFACRLTAPRKSWKIEEKPAGATLTVRFRVPEEDDVLIHFVAFGFPPGAAPKMVVDARVNMFKSSYEDFTVIRNEACAVGSAPGHTLVFRRTAGEGEQAARQRIMTTEYIWVHGGTGYLLNLIAEEAAHQKHLADFEKLLASFEYLEEP
ncbi:MAG: transglutaminase-like domain-containing protein [Planctomycetes bacterium]|nr:transglutaminase-like domain-containing protein [Planctomycetota bacterium]